MPPAKVDIRRLGEYTGIPHATLNSQEDRWTNAALPSIGSDEASSIEE